jgi:hypothetical protein
MVICWIVESRRGPTVRRDNGIEILARRFVVAGRSLSLVGPERLCYHPRPRSASNPRHRADT